MDNYKYLLFDLDGTLTDSQEGIINCVRHAAETMGFDMPERPERFLGPPLYDSFAEYCGLDGEQVLEAVRIYRERYRDIGLFENRVYDGIPEMLERLKNGGKELFVATSKPEVFAVRILEKYGLADYFRFIGGADINGSRNEKWEVIDYVLEKNGITDRSAVLMIGDRYNDVVGAQKTGLRCLGVLWGYGPEEELLEAGADYIAETPQKAAEAILSNS
jgi:phosphoglycolate phosphatase